MPVGTRIEINTADGIIDNDEASRLIEMAEKDTIVKHNSVAFYHLRNHYNDMNVFIKKYVYKKWPGIYGLHLLIAKSRKEFEKLWYDCSKEGNNNEKVGSSTVGFYCPHNYSIVLMERDIENSLNDYDHEEGHHINYISGEGGEITAEFCRLWKMFIRIAMHKGVGYAYFSKLNERRPYGITGRTIKKIGRYRVGSLMFFMVMNHYKGDLTKSAEFVFESDNKTLIKFFYSKLNKYDKKMSVDNIWLIETNKLFNDGHIFRNIETVRKRAKESAN